MEHVTSQGLALVLCVTLGVLGASTGVALAQGTNVIVSVRKPARRELEFRVPPLARVEDMEERGEGWTQSGAIAGSLSVAHRSMQRASRGQGWTVSMAIPLTGRTPRSGLYLWKKQARVLHVMLWEVKAGECGFSWRVTDRDAEEGGGRGPQRKARLDE